jgi:hypothetical protein
LTDVFIMLENVNFVVDFDYFGFSLRKYYIA